MNLQVRMARNPSKSPALSSLDSGLGLRIPTLTLSGADPRSGLGFGFWYLDSDRDPRYGLRWHDSRALANRLRI